MRKRASIFCIIVITWCSLLFTLSVNAQETETQKLLLDSIRYDKLDVAGVKTALDKGANPNAVSYKISVIGYLALDALFAHDGKVERAEEKSVEILQMLFKAGAKLQPCDQDILYSPIAKGWALFTEVLLKNGANPTKEIDGRMPMEIAVRYGQEKIIELLKKHGVRALEPKDAAQQALIGAASEHDIPRMEDAIDAGANVNGSNRQGETALVTACDFFWGIESSASILYLLKKGADPTIQGREDSYGLDKTTALHKTMYWTSFVFDKKNQEKNERLKDIAVRGRSVIKALLEHGALVSARDWYGRTPLHIAAKRNNVVGAQMLIEAGCKIMPTDRAGKTPLDYAESAEMIKLLKDHGAKEE